MIRFSMESDRKAIAELLSICFGDITETDAHTNLDGRYLLYFNKWNKLVGMTGLRPRVSYKNGMEVDWTCTHPAFRNQGVMTELFSRLTKVTDGNIYCDVIKYSFENRASLEPLMSKFGFELVSERNSVTVFPHTCVRGTKCPLWGGANCSCQTDLYLRKFIYTERT